jgi:hypothetical protein
MVLEVCYVVTAVGGCLKTDVPRVSIDVNERLMYFFTTRYVSKINVQGVSKVSTFSWECLREPVVFDKLVWKFFCNGAVVV